jgi:hypothetical protein
MSACIDTPEQIDRFRVLCIKQGLEMYAKFKMLPTRNVNATQLLKMASAVTGKAYKRGEHAIAAQDVAAILNAK